MNRFGWGVTTMIVATLVLAFCARDGGMSGRQGATDARAQADPALVVPVAGVRPDQLVDSWHEPRGGGTRAHEALDIPAPGGTPVRAAFAGTVTKIFTSTAGGLTLYIRAGDLQGYYAHLSGYVAGLREGQHVMAGETVAFVGDTGNAGQGNTHLHFALHRMRPGEGWWQGTPFNPFPLLGGAQR